MRIDGLRRSEKSKPLATLIDLMEERFAKELETIHSEFKEAVADYSPEKWGLVLTKAAYEGLYIEAREIRAERNRYEEEARLQLAIKLGVPGWNQKDFRRNPQLDWRNLNLPLDEKLAESLLKSEAKAFETFLEKSRTPTRVTKEKLAAAMADATHPLPPIIPFPPPIENPHQKAA